MKGNARRQFIAQTGLGLCSAAAVACKGPKPAPQADSEPEAISDGGVEPATLEPESREMATALVAYFAKRELEVNLRITSRYVLEHEKHRKIKKKIGRGDAQRFLLSTNFLSHLDGDVARSSEIKFVSYYDPYVSVCYNGLRG